MKKLIAKSGLFMAGLFALIGVNTPVQADQGISNIREDSPLYLDHAPAQVSNGDVVVGWHYSHQSHESHYSHESHGSHQSHHSHYSGY